MTDEEPTSEPTDAGQAESPKENSSGESVKDSAEATEDGPHLPINVFYDALESVGRPVVTATEVASHCDCSQADAAGALDDLAVTGRVQSVNVETDPTVWFPSDYKETTDRERVVVFPRRREVVVDQPTQFTRAQLSQFAHLEDANREEGYVYQIRREDVWSVPHDRFEDLQRTMRQALSTRSADLEEWVQGQWERARKFRLSTHEDGYTVLTAQSADLMGNVAKQELQEGQLRALISDTEAWIADNAVAEVKRSLYEAGYPVLDERHLEEGDPLPLDLRVDLRDYQSEWVTRFLEKRSGILVGPPGSGKTIAALGVMAAVEGETLVLVPGRELASQWRDTILAQTSLTEAQVGEYHGGTKEIRPVTVATYQTAGMDRHRHLFDDRKWGLIVYDECLTGDTVIETPDGRTTFAELDERYGFDTGWTFGIDEPVRTFVPREGYEWTDVTKVYKSEAPVERIETDTGHTLRATPSHTHIVFDPEIGEVKEQRGIAEGDFLVRPLPVPKPPRNGVLDDVDSLEKERGELIGRWNCDGHPNEIGDSRFSFELGRDDDTQSDAHRLTRPPYYGGRFGRFVGCRLDYTSTQPQMGARLATGVTVGSNFEAPPGNTGLTVDSVEGLRTTSRQSMDDTIRGTYLTSQHHLDSLTDGLWGTPVKSFDDTWQAQMTASISFSTLGDVMGTSTKAAYGQFQQRNSIARHAGSYLVDRRQSKLADRADRLRKMESLHFVEVTDVRDDGTETVYDFETEAHTFLANGLLTHNCHHIPAPIFRRSADLQAKARLGLSATPIREDDKQQQIFTLVGPPIGTNWSALFDAGYVAEPEIEIRLVPWASEKLAEEYRDSASHQRRQVAAGNPAKVQEIQEILRDNPGSKALIFVEYIEQGEAIASSLSVPFVSGKMPHARRRKLFDEFRNGPRDVLVVSRVGDEGIDLPAAEVAIAASGLGGSRRQGAQRAGRTMRPIGKARMYVLATRGTDEEDFARSRTRHLQGKGIRVREQEVDQNGISE